MKSLLEAGVHFGHQTRHWNPKMSPYIFGEKNGIYIINLQLTANALTEACDFLKKTASEGGYVLFVGTKKQAQEVIKTEAERCSMFWVNQRWLGGCLTNFQTIKKSVKRLNQLEKMKEDGLFDKLSKKEVSQLSKEMVKLRKNIGGVRKMERLPQAMVVIDSKAEDIAIKEANNLSIPVVALVDTNCDPDRIDYVVPGNDDAIKSVTFMTKVFADAVKEGRDEFLVGLEKPAVVPEDSDKPQPGAVSEEEVEKLITKEDVKLEEETKKEEKTIAKKPTQRPKKKRKI